MTRVRLYGWLIILFASLAILFAGLWNQERRRSSAFQDAWAISVPTVTVGSDFYIKPISTGDRVIVGFAMDTHELFVELIITPNADAAV